MSGAERLMRVLVIAVAAAALLHCGSRGPIERRPARRQLRALSVETYCLSDTDCPASDACHLAHCVAYECVQWPRLCDDEDPCTLDTCELDTGSCLFSPRTRDSDGDGYRRPLPGYRAGEPGSCGLDCNDNSEQAYPGGQERCDGVDNDCDGVVDNGALYLPEAEEPRRIFDSASPASLVFSPTAGAYGVAFTERGSGATSRVALLAGGGEESLQGFAISSAPSDSFAGDILWTGDEFATVWEARRDGNYEIYFRRLNAQGDLVGTEVRVSRGPGFSLRPSVIFDGHYVVVWEDHRAGEGSTIYGQVLSPAGELVGGNLALGAAGGRASAPVLASGGQRLAVLFGTDELGTRGLAFQTFDYDLGEPSEVTFLPAQDAAGGVLTYLDADRYLVTWHVHAVVPGRSIFGAILSARGEVLSAPRRLTTASEFARFHTVVALGDRVLLLWSESRNGLYGIWALELDTALNPVGPSVPVRVGGENTYGPVAALGNGEVGVLFTTETPGADRQTYYTRLVCQ